MDIDKLRPRRGLLLGKLNKEPAYTASGLEIPELARRIKHEVTVVRLGEPDEKDPWPATFKPGTMLITRPYGGKEISLNGEPYLFLRMEEIVAEVINPENL